jgi:flagella basal body P-ring formation protein FlgA
MKMSRGTTFLLALAAALVSLAAAAPRGADAQRPPTQHAAVAAHDIARGAILTADDIVYRDTVMRAPTDTNHVAPGWVTRRMVAAGELLRAPVVTPPIVLQANQQVNIEWADRNITLKLRGVATRSASLGERIIVRTEYGRRIEATVIGPGRVRID